MVLIQVLGVATLLSFFICCVASAVLQVLAWNRHALTAPTIKALWKPEGYLDAVGVKQMRLAKWLLIFGAVAYLSYGVLLLVVQTLAGSG